MDKVKDLQRRVKELEPQPALARHQPDHAASKLVLHQAAIGNEPGQGVFVERPSNEETPRPVGSVYR